MGEKIVVGPINKGLRNDRTPFVIDNDAFPTLINAYQWRGRVKRKRGTSNLARLMRFFNSTQPDYNPGGGTITLGNDGMGNGTGNILTGPYGSFTLQASGNIVPGSVQIGDTTTSKFYFDQLVPGTITYGILQESGGNTGTINYATGNFVITGAAGDTVYTVFSYYPGLPVLGLEDLVLTSTQLPGTIGFDTTYSYNINTTSPYTAYDVSFYKNPASSGSYVQKTFVTPTTWNGQDYQQFWTTNYQGAFWATNGINVPFSITNIGMQYYGPTTTPALTAAVQTSATTVQFTVVGNVLVVGDFVFANEFVGGSGLNFQTGYVTTAGNTFTVKFPNAVIGAGAYTPGILQLLTNRSNTTVDCIRWYDGDPTNGNVTTPGFVPGNGWVNFMPPLSLSNFSIADVPAAQYYLVGARMIVPFKDRLLFMGPVIQSSSGSPIYLQDTVIYSQNGTPYYTCSFAYNAAAPTDPTLASIVFFPILVPTNQTATAPAYFEDVTGFGGFQSAGLAQPIITVSPNEDVLILGFPTIQTRFVYTGNDIVPFNFFLVNSELGSGSTFSSVTMDEGVISRGQRGYIITAQTGTNRFDLEIPDEVFEITLTNNGNERFCAQRDFINEWIYFTYPANNIVFKFPNETLQYNYRDKSWGIFYETYTTYGQFRRQSGLIWGNVGNTFATWALWTQPWSSGSSTLDQPEVIAGNQQGFVVFRDEGNNEANSLAIQSFSGSTVTVLNHGLNTNDFIIISGCIGSVGADVNDFMFQVEVLTTDTFNLISTVTSGSYVGGGLIQRLYVPIIQTKQFPTAWGMSRKTRIGVQQYLLTATPFSQIQLLIFLSQDSSFAYNNSPILPDPSSTNNALIYSTVLYTCPESENLGLTPANVNLQTPTSNTQAQIWHRINTSLIGDTVQIGFTISPTQMTTLTVSTTTFTITGATTAYPCVLECMNTLSAGQLITISGVMGMTQLNGNTYSIISTTSSTVTINVDSSAFTAYSSGGIATLVDYENAFAEVELHGFVLDVSPSQVLV